MACRLLLTAPMATEATARELLLRAARRIGWTMSDDASIEQIRDEAFARLDRIAGGQDRAHAKNGIRSAVAAALEGNAEYVDAGFWEAAKVLDLEAWDRDVARIEGPARSPGAERPVEERASAP